MTTNVTTLLLALLTQILAVCIPIHQRSWAANDEDAADLIIELGQQVSDLRCADLNGDGLKDLVVLTTSDPPTPEGRGITVCLQRRDGRFGTQALPPEWVQGAFLCDLGEYDGQPGSEILIVNKDSLCTVGYKGGAPALVHRALPHVSLFQAAVHRRLVFLDSSHDLDGDGLDDPIIPADNEYFTLTQGLEKRTTLFAADGDRSPVTKRIEGFENSFFAVIAEAGKIRVLPSPGRQPLIVMECGGKILGSRFEPATQSWRRMESTSSGFSAYGTDIKVGTLEYSGTLFGDFDRSGKPNLLLSQRSGRIGILTNLQTKHTFFEMLTDPGRARITLEPRQIIANAGICARPTFSDLNADGHNDLILRFVKASVLTKFLEALLDRVVITCQAFLYQPEKGNFSFEPDWNREVPVPSDCFETVGIEGLAMMNSDFNGDDRPDLVIYESDRLLFYRGRKKSGFLGVLASREIDFRSRPFYQVGGPFPGPLVTVDIDGEGRKEIITFGETFVRVIHVL